MLRRLEEGLRVSKAARNSTCPETEGVEDDSVLVLQTQMAWSEKNTFNFSIESLIQLRLAIIPAWLNSLECGLIPGGLSSPALLLQSNQLSGLEHMVLPVHLFKIKYETSCKTQNKNTTND